MWTRVAERIELSPIRAASTAVLSRVHDPVAAVPNRAALRGREHAAQLADPSATLEPLAPPHSVTITHPTLTRFLRTAVAWKLAPALAAIGLASCLNDSPVASGDTTVRATFSVNVVGLQAGGTVRIRVGYRSAQQVLFLPSTPQQVNVGAGTTVILPVTVDIGRCLADRNRASSGLPGCKLLIELLLSDQTGSVIDSDTTDAGGSPTIPGGQVNFGTVTIGVIVASVGVTPISVRLNVGEEQVLTATARDAKGATIPAIAMTWAANDPTVAQLTPTGTSTVTVRGLKLGATTITATARGKTSPQVLLAVAPPTLNIRQLPGAGCVIAGQTLNLEVDSPPAAVTWTSSNPNAVTVGATTGIVTGVLPGGSATITATSAGVTGTTSVCVALFTVTPPTLSVGVNQSIPLTVAAAGGTVTFTSSAPQVATVDNNGVVRGVSVGTATITGKITAASGSQSIPISVSVSVASIVIKLKLSRAPVGRSVTYSAVVQDANGNVIPNPSVTWSIADPTIGALSGTLGDSVSVKALKLGSTTITASTGGASASAPFTATPVIPASRLEQVSGNGGTCPTFSSLCTFVARAVDVDGYPVTGETVTWSTSNQGCAPSKTVTTDADGLTSTTNLCSATKPGLYEQTVSLLSVNDQQTFHYTLQGLLITLDSIDAAGVARYSVTSLTPAQGLTAVVTYKTGPATNYVTTLTLSTTTTPATLVVGFDKANLPVGAYTFDVTVSTTTQGLGPAVATRSFSAPFVFSNHSSVQSARPTLGAPAPMPRRAP